MASKQSIKNRLATQEKQQQAMQQDDSCLPSGVMLEFFHNETGAGTLSEYYKPDEQDLNKWNNPKYVSLVNRYR